MFKIEKGFIEEKDNVFILKKRAGVYETAFGIYRCPSWVSYSFSGLYACATIWIRTVCWRILYGVGNIVGSAIVLLHFWLVCAIEAYPPSSITKIKKRVYSILFPTIVIGGLYAILNHISAMDMLQDRFKAGYWFTITLFEYFVIVDVLRLMACKSQRLYDALLIGASIVCYGLSMPTVQRMYGDITIAHILGLAQWKYFIFFTLGMFVKRASETIISDKGGAAIVSTFLIVYAANAICDFQFGGLLYNINLLLKETSIVLMAYYVFYTYRYQFSSQTRVGKWLSKIGTYTLEIYLIHYFVLPRQLKGVVDIVGLDENPLLALIVSMVIALIVVCVVLVFVAILQSNSYIKKMLWNK